MSDNEKKIEELASRIMVLARNTLVVNLRFMDSAISRLKPMPQWEAEVLATDGEKMLYHPSCLLKLYQKEKELPARYYLHMLMHCIYQHFYVGLTIQREYWDLACDIAVENSIHELDLQAVSSLNDSRQEQELASLKKEVKMLTAEHLYRYFQEQEPDETQIQRLKDLFQRDYHDNWYQHERQGESSDDNGEEAKSNLNILEDWKNISEQIQMDLTTFTKERGERAGSMMQNLQEVTREKYDYTEFLKKFAVMGEVMKVNDDEFDYIFYTYGLMHYKKMPLIEPLEYKEQKRIKEFVIAIDTSGSVVGEDVQAFVQKTYNILKSTESFFQKINLHIIQCDMEIQEAVKITSQEEFDEYLKNMQILGLGGTDFRPVFEYVNELIEKKEFSNLKGMIYFTDGFGVFPEKKPDYETAFVFVQEEYTNPEVPAWAIKLILRKDEI